MTTVNQRMDFCLLHAEAVNMAEQVDWCCAPHGALVMQTLDAYMSMFVKDAAAYDRVYAATAAMLETMKVLGVFRHPEINVGSVGYA